MILVNKTQAPVHMQLLAFVFSFCAMSALADVDSVKVSALNYIEAKTSLHFDRVIARSGGINLWAHVRLPTPLDQQRITRMNRDTLYSSVVVDVSKGAMLSMPEANGKYMSAAIINEHHHINKIFHGAGEHLLKAEDYGTEFVMVTVRILVNANDPKDIAQVNKLQDKLVVTSHSANPYTHPNYELQTFTETGKHLVELAGVMTDAKGAYGAKKNVNTIKHLLATAYGWGGLPDTEAAYINKESLSPNTAYSMTINNVPVKGFWSISVYNKDGYFEKNSYDAYSVNNLTAKRNDDNSITIHFGGNPKKPNFLPITDGWSYVVRMYQPSAEIIEGKWLFPDIEPI